MKCIKPLGLVIAIMALTACGTDSGFEQDYFPNMPGMNGMPGMEQSSGGGEGTIAGLTDFTISVDETPLLNEIEPTCDKKYLASSLGCVPEVSIVFSASNVSINGTVAPFDTEVSTDGGKITVTEGNVVTVSCKTSANYILTSNSNKVNGAFVLKKNTMDNIITLDNVHLTYDNIQGKGISAAKEGNVFIQLKNGSTNSISSYKKAISCGQDPTEEGNEQFTGGNVVISGEGKLNLASTSAGALYSEGGEVYIHKSTILNIKPALNKHGIAGYKGVTIAGGVQNIELSGEGPKGVKSDGTLCFIGGRTTIINTGFAVWEEEENDYSSAACVKGADVMVDGGMLLCYATGNGGKGIRADNTMTVKSGTVKVITEGQNIVRINNSDKVYASTDNVGNSVDDANPKGIHVGDKDASPATGTLLIEGGDVRVKTLYSEAIESKMELIVNNGNVMAYASDDAINVGISSESNRGNSYANKGEITINGGNVLAYSTSNDAIDSNGTIVINGGNVLACGATGAECALDCDNNTFLINGGTVIGLGGNNISTPASSSKQPVLITNCSIAKGTTYSLGAYSFVAPVSYSNATAVLSDGSFSIGGSVSFAGNTTTLSSQITGGSQGMGGGPGMGGPGRR